MKKIISRNGTCIELNEKIEQLKKEGIELLVQNNPGEYEVCCTDISFDDQDEIIFLMYMGKLPKDKAFRIITRVVIDELYEGDDHVEVIYGIITWKKAVKLVTESFARKQKRFQAN